MRRTAVLLALLCGACAGASPGGGPAGLGKLRADPPGLGYDCVAPGCAQERTVELVAEGGTAVRILAIQLDLASSGDYELSPGVAPPFDLQPGERSEVKVSYSPSDAVADSGALLIDYAPVTSTERQQLRVELAARLFGTPRIEVAPLLLSFGYIPQGGQGTLDVSIRNVGTGNALVEIPGAALQSGVDFAVTPEVPPALVLGPAEEQKLTVTYAPTTEGVHLDRLHIQSNDVENPSVEVLVRGTSIEGPRAALSPGGPIDLGDVRVGGSAEQVIELSNLGGSALQIAGTRFEGAGAGHFQVNVPETEIAPFGATSLTITYAPTAIGDHAATFVLVTNDPTSPELRVEFLARGIDPRLVVTPDTVSFGTAVLGWTRGPVRIEARNEGFGPVTIERVFMAPGSSPEFELGTLPGLPLTLNQGNRIEFEVTYTVTTLASVEGRLIIESDDPNNARIEVPLAGEGVTCEVGCAMAHATPRCGSGICEIQTCDSGYYDTDGQATTGCECRIESPEPSKFCAEARWLGSLNDDAGDSVSIQGQLHSADDVDWYNVYGEDSGGINELFGDDYDIRITFSAPSGYKMCVLRAKREPHENVCPAGADGACTPVTSYRDDGSWGSSDSADYFIKIFTTGQQTTCGTYTLTIKNG